MALNVSRKGDIMPVMTAREVLDKFWDGDLPVNPEKIAKNSGVQVIRVDILSEQNISGAHIEGVIYVNSHDSRRRQRFTVAHELGHNALGHGAALRDVETGYGTDPNEIEANRFAAELLMPEVAVDYIVKNRTQNPVEMAEIFDVSLEAMRFRLKNLGWL